MRQSTALFDDLGRMLKSLGAYAGEETLFAYDANGNMVSVTDPLNPGQACIMASFPL